MPRDQSNSGSALDEIVLRELLWRSVSGLTTRHADGVEAVQRAREGLGLPRYQGGMASDTLQRLTAGYALPERAGRPAVLRRAPDGSIVLSDPNSVRWWRPLFAPDPVEVRTLAERAELCMVDADKLPGVRRLVVRSPTLPDVDLLVGAAGDLASFRAQAASYMRHRRKDSPLPRLVPGVYFYLRSGQIYIGKTREIDVRERLHRARGAWDWMVFVARSETEGTMTADVLEAAEALLITHWQVLARVANRTRGIDAAPPDQGPLREAAAFATVATAAVRKLVASAVVGPLPPPQDRAGLPSPRQA